MERATRFTVLVQLDGRDMATVTAALSARMRTLPEIALKLNARPRKTLDFETPADRLEALLR